MRFENEEFLLGGDGSSMIVCIKSPSIVSFSQKLVFNISSSYLNNTESFTLLSYCRTIGEHSQTTLVRAGVCTPSSRKDDGASVSTNSSKHRSRRESPRKSNTTNSRSNVVEKCKVIRELKEANLMPTSPAFEPVEMTVWVKCTFWTSHWAWNYFMF